MPPIVASRAEIQRRLAAGESQRAIAQALGISRWELWHVLQTPEEEPEPADEPEEAFEAQEPEPEEEPEAVTASEALTWLQAYAERVESQAQQAYAPWHTLKLVQELSTLLVAVIKELRANANDTDPD